VFIAANGNNTKIGWLKDDKLFCRVRRELPQSSFSSVEVGHCLYPMECALLILSQNIAVHVFHGCFSCPSRTPTPAQAQKYIVPGLERDEGTASPKM
jgi:hypothetical protein